MHIVESVSALKPATKQQINSKEEQNVIINLFI